MSMWIQLGTAILSQVVCLGITFSIRHPFISSNGMLLSFFNCFGGGVLLSIALIHMLPEMMEQFEKFVAQNSYPLGMLFIILGYFILVVLEKVLFRHEHHHVLTNESKPLFLDSDTKNVEPTLFIEKSDLDTESTNHSHDNNDERSENFKTEDSESHNHHLLEDTGDEELHTIQKHVLPTEKLVHGHRTPYDKEGSLVTPILLFIVLSIHAIFEGIVLGLQSEIKPTLSIAIAIILHKPVEALTLGIVMCVEVVSRANYFIISVIFSSVAPVGILIGLLVKITSTVPPILVGIFSALAIGSFLYISTTEIIADEFHRTTSNKEKWMKMAAVFIGICFVSISEIWLGDSHSHGH